MNNPYKLHKDNIVFKNPQWELGKIVEIKNGVVYDKSASRYCKKRVSFLEKYLGEKRHYEFEVIKPALIEYNLANLKQLTLEVTDACNLKCKYCGYGELYGDYDKRENNMMTLSSVKLLIDYLTDLWNSPINQSHDKPIYISFYGGEPLVNFHFIEQAVAYINTKKLHHNSIIYSMTTNAVLLKRHIDYLVEHKFRLLISLDGNKSNNSYRVFPNGDESFPIIKANLDYVKEHYPSFFEENINFNSVLHNRNSVSQTFSYIKQEFDKVPNIAELSTSGIREDKVDLFKEMYNSQYESLHQSNNVEHIKEEMSASLGEVRNWYVYLSKYSGNVFQNYNSLLNESEISYKLPTGTCTPFSKKLFVTVTGKILPCERIGHRFSLGYVDANTLKLDFEEISAKYNDYYARIIHQCRTCYRIDTCPQCLFNLEDIDSNPIHCPDYLKKSDFVEQLNNSLSDVEKNKKLYEKFLNEITLEL